MKTTSVVFETEDYDEIMFKALKGAVVDCSVDIRNADGTFKETSVRLSARGEGCRAGAHCGCGGRPCKGDQA